MRKLFCVLLFLLVMFNFLDAQNSKGFSYQAVVRDKSGNVLDYESVNFRFSLLQKSSNGVIVYSETQNTKSNQFGLVNFNIGKGKVESGLFDSINWASGPYYLKVELDVAGGTNYQLMGISQLLSVPYAQYAEKSGNGGTLDDIYNSSGTGSGRQINVTTMDKELYLNCTAAGSDQDITAKGMKITNNNDYSIGLYTQQTSNGAGIVVNSTSTTTKYSAIQTTTASNSLASSALLAVSTGVSPAIQAISQNQEAIYALKGANSNTSSGCGIYGTGMIGVYGEGSIGEYGIGYNKGTGNPVYGIVGLTTTDGQNSDPAGYGIYSLNNIMAEGNIVANGSKNFMIDHPLDPTNKFLKHASVESNEILNMYRGNVTLDSNGEAVVKLPDYFSGININYSYNLTPIGGFFNVCVKEEIKDNKFVIAGTKPGMKVSWTVYAERNDLYMQKYPESKNMEPFKSANEKGKYSRPELYNQPKEKGIFYTPEIGKKENNLKNNQLELIH
ncbi:MAG: hypothetical protein Q8880_01770 [Bacteroidota bacterium]|nr:hypothetical protein [Bacteroidota bacterium]